jgi:serine/threonine protein kinase
VHTVSRRELYDVVVSEAPMSPDKSRTYFLNLMAGIRHIHECGFCHRDIKLENILLENDVVKICDFGFATRHSNESGDPIIMTRQCGSLVYASPQVTTDTIP